MSTRASRTVPALRIPWSDGWLHPSFSAKGGETLRRARLFVAFARVALLAAVFSLAQSLCDGVGLLAATALLGVIGVGAGLFLVRLSGRLELAVHVVIGSSVLVATLMNLVTGMGLPALFFPVGMLPVGALLVSGRRAALPWTIIVLGGLLILRLLAPGGLEPLVAGWSLDWSTAVLQGALIVSLGVYIVGSAHESLRERAFAEEERARHEAERAALLKGEFLANMSHELRTPMHAVMGLTELILETPLDERQRQYALTVRDSASSLLVILNDILDLSKIDAGMLALEALPIDLAREADFVVRLLRQQVEAKGLKLTVELHPSPMPPVLGDATRLRQILVNLVGNAVKFTEKGGITIRLQAEPLPGSERVNLTLTVSDTGRGIPKDKLTAIFQPFHQLGAATERSLGGTGLGLVITQRLVALMDGHIDVESELAQGTCFTVNLLLPLASSLSTTAPVPKPRVSGRGRRVLVADDTPASLLFSTRLLESRGFSVLAVEDGQQAVEAFTQGHFDLVFMDYQMPGLDGLDATRAIRDLDGGRNTPVIGLTASVLAEERESCLEAGMQDVLSKPFRGAELDQLLARVLDESEAA